MNANCSIGIGPSPLFMKLPRLLSRLRIAFLILLPTCHLGVSLTLMGANPTHPVRSKAFPEPDSDGDGLTDVQELRFGSDPFVADTDGDGANDLAEFVAGTLPRDKTSVPLFQTVDRDRQLLGGDLLRLRPVSIKPLSLKTNITIVTNDPPPEGGDPTYTTNKEVVTNYTTYQWFREGRSLPGQTNLNLVLFGVERPDSGRYTLEARLESATQREPLGIRIDVLGVRPIRELPRPAGELVTLVVWNTGPGIPAAELPLVFERFHRGDKSRSDPGHCGLGLAIAESIVRAHGGQIEVQSDPVAGTTFAVSLPA